MPSQKRQNDLCFQGKPFNVTVIQACAPTRNTEDVDVEQFYEDLDLELLIAKFRLKLKEVGEKRPKPNPL